MTFETYISPANARPVDSSFIQTRSVRRGSPRLYERGFKRLFDIAFVLTIAPFVLMLVAVLCPLIMRDGGSPFYSQKRLGRHGRVFRMWKLRSMVVDADKNLDAYLDTSPERRREWDAHQKLRNDPRITPVGRLIRKASLDELPQFWNVLIGDMSVVGPRPMTPDQRAIYPGTAYHAMRPGITGPWQITVRNDSDFAERAAYDSHYYRNQSIGTDLRVMLRTFRVMVAGTGC